MQAFPKSFPFHPMYKAAAAHGAKEVVKVVYRDRESLKKAITPAER